MTDEEKIIREKTLGDFDRELGRDGNETDSERGVPPCGLVWRARRKR